MDHFLRCLQVSPPFWNIFVEKHADTVVLYAKVQGPLGTIVIPELVLNTFKSLLQVSTMNLGFETNES